MPRRQAWPLVPFPSPIASQLSDFGRPRASSCNDTPYEGEITTARLKLKSPYARTHYGERPEVLAHRLQHRLGMRSVKKRRSTLAWPSAALFTSPRFFSSDNV